MQKLVFSQFHLVCCISSILVMIYSFIAVFTLIYYTEKLSRLNLLIICKYLFLFFIYFLHLFFSINNLFDKDYSYSTSVISSFYLCFSFLLQVAINIEYYRNLRNPCYILKYIFNNEFEIFIKIFIILIISCFIAIFPFFFQKEKSNIYDFILSKNDQNYFSICFQENKLLSPLITLIFFVLFYLFFQTRKFYRNLKDKSLEHLKYSNGILLVINSLYLIFVISSSLIKQFFDDINSQIIHIAFNALSLLDSFFIIFRIFHSGFYYYFLNKTFIGCIYKIIFFGYCCRNISFSKNGNLNITKHTESINNFYSFENYIIEDYILDTLDFMLQSITTGLSIVYEDFRKQTYFFQSKIDFLSVENQRIKSSHDINGNNISSSNLLSSINENEEKEENMNNEVEDESTSNMNSLYNFFKVCSRSYIGDKSGTDLFSFNNCEDANIMIQPLFVKESIESMNLYKITKQEIIKSLLSHKFLSLLMTNSKRIFFKNINNLIISTYDCKFLIELHTDIKITNSFNNLLENYFHYLNYGDSNSFLCLLIGVFRIKINNFKEMAIFVSQNPLIEKIPNDYFNYWEIMRFNSDTKKFIKLISSKDNDTFIINEKTGNTSSSSSLSKNKHNLFHLDDFDIFKEAIKNDIKFLKSISSNNFCLVLLYYEFENRKMTKHSLFIDQKTKFNYDYPSSLIKANNLKNFSDDIRKNKILSLSIPSNSNNYKNHEITNINETNEDIKDITDKEITINVDMKKKTDNISYISKYSNNSRSMIMQNGFDVSFNNFRGLLYIRWDNIFYQKKCLCNKHFYEKYINDIMQYFSN